MILLLEMIFNYFKVEILIFIVNICRFIIYFRMIGCILVILNFEECGILLLVFFIRKA